MIPQTEAQRLLPSRALQISGDIGEAHWLMFERSEAGFPWPFLTILVFCLSRSLSALVYLRLAMLQFSVLFFPSFGRQRGFSDCRYGTPIFWVCSSLQRSAARRPRPTWPMTGFPKPSRHPYHLSSISSRRMRYPRRPLLPFLQLRRFIDFRVVPVLMQTDQVLRRQLKSFFLPGAFIACEKKFPGCRSLSSFQQSRAPRI
jgi:hypothetical protein